MGKVKDYIRLYKFRVWTLLIFTAIFSYLIALKAGYEFSLDKFLFMIIGGTFAIMGNGALNEYLEVETDRIMDRTKKRPLVKGTISKSFALYSGISLVIAGFLISYFFINALTASFIALATIIYMIYTFIKKRTWLNVIIGGFAGSCTAWGGWSAATGSFNLFAFLLGMLIYFWTNPHIWALALRLKDDYQNAGIKMLTAMVDDKRAARFIAISSLPLPFISLILAYIGSMSLFFIVFSIALNLIFLTIAFSILINPSKEKSWLLFKFSTPYLALIFLGIYIDPKPLEILL